VTVVAVGTVKGGLGATTTALVLAAALAERRPTLLVEADPSGGTLVGVCPSLAATPTLELLMSERRDQASVEQVLQCTQPLGDLLVAAAPPEPFTAHLVVDQPRSPWMGTLRKVDGHVVCDVGRLQAGSPAWTVLQASDEVVLVTGSDPMGLAATVEWAEQRGRVAPGVSGLAVDATRIVVVAPAGAGRHGGPSERIAAELGARFAGQLPWDPAGIDLLRRGASLRHRSLRRTGLVGAARALAAGLSAGEEEAA
jgi:pilus assembly protein CpaE